MGINPGGLCVGTGGPRRWAWYSHTSRAVREESQVLCAARSHNGEYSYCYCSQRGMRKQGGHSLDIHLNELQWPKESILFSLADLDSLLLTGTHYSRCLACLAGSLTKGNRFTSQTGESYADQSLLCAVPGTGLCRVAASTSWVPRRGQRTATASHSCLNLLSTRYG